MATGAFHPAHRLGNRAPQGGMLALPPWALCALEYSPWGYIEDICYDCDKFVAKYQYQCFDIVELTLLSHSTVYIGMALVG